MTLPALRYIHTMDPLMETEMLKRGLIMIIRNNQWSFVFEPVEKKKINQESASSAELFECWPNQLLNS